MYTLDTHGIHHTQFGSILTITWPYEKNLSLKFLNHEIRKFPFQKLTFFPRQAIAKILLGLQFRLTWCTPYPVWFDLNNSLTRWKSPVFKIRYSRNSQISVWKPYFFPRQAIPKILLVLQFRYPGDAPCRVWFDLDILTQRKRPVFKIRESRNPQISFSKTNFFPRQSIAKILLVLQSRFTLCTPYPVWFDLNNSLTRWKRPIFKILYSRNSQISRWKLYFFPRQAIVKILCFVYSRYPWYTPYPVWFDLDNSLTLWKLFIFKIRKSRNSQISFSKTNFFFPRQALAKILLGLQSRFTWCTQYPVWFDLNNSLTRWKRPIFKIRYSRNSQISV